MADEILNLDFTGVETGFVAMPIGLYRLRIEEKPLVAPSKKSGESQVNFKFAVVEPGFEGRILFHHCSLQQQALWKLRKTLEAFGVETPQGPIQLDLKTLVGREALAQVGQEDYEGKTKNNITDLMKVDGQAEYPGAGSTVAPF